MPNTWYKQTFVQSFDCESINFKKAGNMFGRMEIAEYIYKVVVEPSYKNPHGKTPTVLITAGKREENPPRHGIAPIRMRALASA